MGRYNRLLGVLPILFLLATEAPAELVCKNCHKPNPGGVYTNTPHNTDLGCRDVGCSTFCHPKDLNQLQHPAGPNTPLPSPPLNDADRTAICNTCHNTSWPGVYHKYQINVSAGSATNPGFVDLNDACGQCHGGGDNSTDNPPIPWAAYLTKAQLGTYAVGIHHDRPQATFGYTFGNPNTMLVNVDASGSACTSVCDNYDWDWGDGSPHDSDVAAVTASHTYANEGTYTIVLTVKDTGVGTGTFSQVIAAKKPDSPPAAAGDLTFNSNTWSATLDDASTDDNGVKQVTVNWGDGSVISSDNTAPFGPFTRAYSNTGTYTITQKAIDTIGQQGTKTYTVSPAYFSISGTVKNRLGTLNLPSATVTVKKGTTTVKTVYTNSSGAFTAGSLKPGTYTLTVTKSGYTFAVPAATVTVGPNASSITITATAP